MRSLLALICLFIFLFPSHGQLKSGFDKTEAKEMMALCNSYTYLDLYGDDTPIIPEGYRKIHTSPTLGMDNKFQVYTHGKIGIISFRGSTDKKASWLENIDSAMLPIEGSIRIKTETFDYKFGTDTAGGVHSGYTLGIGYLHKPLLEQLEALNKQGIYDVILTGHSQGGALAVLTRAYLEHLEKGLLNSKNTFKVYTFAQPMSGNKEFVAEYNRLFCKPGMSYSLINPNDMVPQMPLSFNDSTYLSANLIALFNKDEEFDKTKMFIDGMLLLFEDRLKGTVKKFGKSVHAQIEKELGEIELPEPKDDINYAQVGNVQHLPPPEYPLEMKDSSQLDDPEFLRTHPRDKNGVFEDKSVYRKVSMSQHHKPYNYYTAILRTYFPAEYDAIEPKSFGL